MKTRYDKPEIMIILLNEGTDNIVTSETSDPNDKDVIIDWNN